MSLTSENKNSPVIGVIFGAGTHIDMLQSTLLELGYPLVVVRYHPNFSLSYYENGKLTKVIRKKNIDLISKVYWFIKYRFYKPGEGNKWLFRLYNLYDKKASKHLKNCTHLIAWPLVSEKCILEVKKTGGRITLEYPMIHVNTWQNLVQNECNKFNVSSENIFIQDAVNKILHEINSADVINVLSAYAKTTFEEQGVESGKINVLAPVLPELNTVLRNKPFDPEKPVFMYAGRLDINKGCQYLLEAFSNLNLKNARLFIAGRITKEFETLASKYESDKRIEFLGHVDKLKLNELYQQTDFLVVPSVQESYGMVIPEALSRGITVLASNRTGASELLQPGVNGYIFEPCNSKDLEKTMKLAIEKAPFEPIKVRNTLALQQRPNAYLNGWKTLLALT